jgi:hypothetical protein
MEVAILHLGSMSQVIPATSVLKGMRKYDTPIAVTWVVNEDKVRYVNKYNSNVKRTISLKTFLKEKIRYDLLINLCPFGYFDFKDISSFAHVVTGFGFDSFFNSFEDVFVGAERKYDFNIFQLYYMLCGLTWKGQGYDLNYYPKTKTTKKRIGVSAANANLRNYILDNIELENNKIWYIPYRKNIFKRMDEINRCSKIITDDMTVFHLAMYLRKYVYFLKTYDINYNLEFFGNGQIHNVPTSVFQ